jgi:hypothetical protein
MREDISKVITECYRIKYEGFRKPDSNPARFGDYRDEDMSYYPKIESMRAHRITGRTFEFGENLNPLLRYITQQNGKHVNDVYSEVKKALNGFGTMNDHVILHLNQYLEKRNFRIASDIRTKRLRFLCPNSSYRNNTFYPTPGYGGKIFFVDEDQIIRVFTSQSKNSPNRKTCAKKRTVVSKEKAEAIEKDISKALKKRCISNRKKKRLASRQKRRLNQLKEMNSNFSL